MEMVRLCKAKDYLQKIGWYDSQINSRLKEIKTLEDMCMRITPVYKSDVVSVSGNQDKIGTAVAKIVDLRDAVNKSIDAYVDLKKQALELLSGVENKTYYDILYRRYFSQETLLRIACDMNYSYRNICKLHGKALVEYQKIMNKNGIGV